MVAKTQSRGSSSEILWDFKLTYLHTTILKFLEIVYFDFYEKLQDFSYKALPNCVASLLARGTIITSVGKVWACKETDVQKIKSWLLRDTCSTELCNNRNVVFWCETWAWFGCKAEGLEHLAWDFQFTVKLLSCFTMGKSIMPNNEGQLDNVLLCTVVSKRKLGAGVRCTSVL